MIRARQELFAHTRWTAAEILPFAPDHAPAEVIHSRPSFNHDETGALLGQETRDGHRGPDVVPGGRIPIGKVILVDGQGADKGAGLCESLSRGGQSVFLQQFIKP